MAKTEDFEVQQYIASYQDVLWIDDMDNQQSSNVYKRNDSYRKEKYKIDNIKSWFPKQYSGIDLVMQMKDAFEKIVNNCDKYNLVIFDMDMRKGFSSPDGDIDSISKKFSDYNIICTADLAKDNMTKVMTKISGAYLYLLLLTKGYPADRMIIYTGNFIVDSSAQDQSEKEKLKGYLEKYCPALKFDKQSFQKAQEYELDLETYYPENNYYRIRRLVLQACDYWKKEIAGKKDEDIPFNQVYFSKDKDKQNSIENFKELLERIEMMFPVIPPSSPEKVYYQAARILCEYHEESAKIQIVDSYIYPFHAVCRNFRNWSSHNKFNNSEMSADIFALLFCTALRTYFDFLIYKDNNKEKISKFNKELFYYESNYGYKMKDNDIKRNNESFNNIKNKLKAETSLLSVLDKNKRRNIISYSELVYIWGENQLNTAEIKYILYPIIMRDYFIKFTANTIDSIKLNCNTNYLFEDKKGKSDDNGFMKLAFNEACRICGYLDK